MKAAEELEHLYERKLAAEAARWEALRKEKEDVQSQLEERIYSLALAGQDVESKLKAERDDLNAVAGQQWADADGVEWPVYVRVQNLIVDYVDFAMASGTLQNQTCPECECPCGCFHLTNRTWPLRASRVESARVAAAHAAGGSAAAVRRRCQAFGLQSDEAPLRTAAA